MRSPIFISWEPHPDSSTHCGRRRRIALTLPRALALRGAPLQYNSAFYAYSIGHIQRSIPALNGSDRCCDCRYDRWGNGFSPHSFLCAEAARIGHDDRNDHRVFFHRPIDLCPGLGPRFRPLRTQAGSAHWTERLRGGVLCLRVCQCHLVTVPLPRRAGPRRRDDRCAAGVCERYGAFRRSFAFLAGFRRERMSVRCWARLSGPLPLIGDNSGRAFSQHRCASRMRYLHGNGFRNRSNRMCIRPPENPYGMDY